MQLFKPLADRAYLSDYIRSRIKNQNHPRSRRYAKKYDLLNLAPGNDLPKNIENLVGFAKNTFSRLARGYEHGKQRDLWMKKAADTEGPLTMGKEPDNPDGYRKVLLLNRVDLFIHTALSHQLRDSLLRSNHMTRTRSREEIIRATKKLIENAMASDLRYYLRTDIVQFGSKFDIDRALSTLLEALHPEMDSEDRELLYNVYNSLRKKVGPSPRMGSPLDQLLGEWALSRLDESIRQYDEFLFNKCYIRVGEDMLCFRVSVAECKSIYEQFQRMARDRLGSGCELHELERQGFARDTAGSPVLDDTKSAIGSFPEYGLQFCGYEYGLQGDDLSIKLRLSTFNKIRSRIERSTEGRGKRYPWLPETLPKRMRKLNNLFGFYWGGEGWRFSRHLGVNQLFCLPDGLDLKALHRQAGELNHYMLRRLRHLHLRDVRNTQMRDARPWREQVDKGYRVLGLRTVRDGIHRMRNVPRSSLTQ